MEEISPKHFLCPENDFMKIEVCGKPEISRGNRTFENYYINGRFVKNRIIAKDEDAYRGFSHAA